MGGGGKGLISELGESRTEGTKAAPGVQRRDVMQRSLVDKLGLGRALSDPPRPPGLCAQTEKGIG